MKLPHEPTGSPKNMEPLTRDKLKRRRAWLLGAGAALGLMAVLLFLPLPRTATRWLAITNASWLLTRYTGNESRALEAGRRLMGIWVQQNLIAHMHRAQQIPDGGDDARRVAARVLAVNRVVASQVALPHWPVNSPTVVSGLGWCDGVNGVAANLLSWEFSRAQIVGLADPVTGAGHSFGRVWSAQYRDWLYFDIWSDEVVVFRSRPGRPAEYLVRHLSSPVRAHDEAERAKLGRMYDIAHGGWAHNEVRPTFGGYLALKLRQSMRRHREPAPPPPPPVPAEPPPPAPPEFNSPNTSPANEIYLAARIDHLMGDTAAARRGYEEVVRREGAQQSTFGRAARLFARRLGGRL